MGYLLDTDVVIHLRDGEKTVWARLRSINPPFAVSAISRIELENGVYQDARWQAVRPASLDKILEDVGTIEFTMNEVEAYRDIVAAVGFSKRKISDRITAATALVHDLTLITMNGADYRDIPGLKLEAWESPAP